MRNIICGTLSDTEITHAAFHENDNEEIKGYDEENGKENCISIIEVQSKK